MATNAVTFNGSTQYGKILNWSALDGLTDVTVEGWFNQDSSGGTSYARGVDIGNATIDFLALQTENATPSTGVNFRVVYSGTNADGYKPSGVFDTNTWVHVAIIGSHNNKAKIIKNGSEISYNLQQTPTGTIQDSTGMDVFWGCSRVLGRLWKGKQACFRVWNVARTIAEISDNKDYYLDPNFETGLIVNCNVDEGSGSTITNDVSGGNNCILTGSPTWTTGPTLTQKVYMTASRRFVIID